MNIKQYLDRIKVSDPGNVSLESLSTLQNQHMLSIPFENLDVMNNVPIPLDIEVFFNKIIKNKRGGFCYELNGLFHWLLKELGYSNYLIGCTIHRGNDEWAMFESHASQIVVLDQPYLVDVGFGDSARVPLPLTGEEKKDISGEFRVIELEDGYYHKQKKVDGQWTTKYRFLNKEKKLEDFSKANHYVQTSPDSHFTQRRLITIATPNGRRTLAKNKLTITKDGKKYKEEVSDNQIKQLLEEMFGIHIDKIG